MCRPARASTKRDAVPCSVPGGHAVLSGIRAAGVTPRQPHDRLGSAEGGGLGRHLVAQRGERTSPCIGDRRLQRDAPPRQVPEAGGIDRLLKVHSEHDEVEQQLHVALRLHRAAHDPEAEPRGVSARAVGLRDERGNDGWNGRFPGATVFGSPGSSVNPAPRSWSANPVPGTTTLEPNASYSELMNDTMLPLESATVR